MTTAEQIEQHRISGSWRRLESLAAEMVDDASARAGSQMRPLLGGGTRLMLALEHRISDGIDLVVRDPQWLGHVSPRLNDRFKDRINAYDEGSTSLKLRAECGEIDFIVGMSLLGRQPQKVDDCCFDLEPVAEGLAKKLFYRGWAMTPGDLFDWWAIESRQVIEPGCRRQIEALVAPKAATILAALNALQLSAGAIAAWKGIRAPEIPDMQDCLVWARAQMSSLAT